MSLLGVGFHRILGICLFIEMAVGVAELKEFQVGVLAVGIVGDALQSAKEN